LGKLILLQDNTFDKEFKERKMDGNLFFGVVIPD